MRMPATDVHALIIGGGPGGAMSALKLARLGWRVMVVERGPRGRHKACGHCLNQRAMDALRREGALRDVSKSAVGHTRRLRVHGSDGATIETSLPVSNQSEAEAGLVVERSTFDQLLLDRAAEAGARILQPASVRIRALDENGAILEIGSSDGSVGIRTNFLIGADGVGSTVARAAGLVRRKSTGRKYGFSFDLDISGGAKGFDRGTIDMFLVPGGYLGVVSHGRGQLHIAALVDHNSNIAARQPLAFVQEAARRHARLQNLGLHRMTARRMEHLKAIGPMPWRPRTITRPFGDSHIALVGDAAGYIEPFTGEGMGWAISAADALGQAAVTCEPGRWTAEASCEYGHLWRERIGRRQRLCGALAWVLERPKLASMMLRLAARAPRLTDRMAAEVVAA